MQNKLCKWSDPFVFLSENLADDQENLKEFLEEAELQQYFELFR